MHDSLSLKPKVCASYRDLFVSLSWFVWGHPVRFDAAVDARLGEELTDLALSWRCRHLYVVQGNKMPFKATTTSRP